MEYIASKYSQHELTLQLELDKLDSILSATAPEWDARPTLQSVTLLAFTPTDIITVGAGINRISLTVGELMDTRTGRSLPAIIDWAEKLALMRSPDIQDCERLVENYNEREKLSQYILGTAMLSHAIKKYKVEANRWIRRGCIVQDQKQKDVVPRASSQRLPTVLPHVHRANVLVAGTTVNTIVPELPELSADWREYFHEIDGKGIDVRGTLKNYPRGSASLPQAGMDYMYFSHPTYGRYGVSSKPLKRKFRLHVRSGIDDKTTHSIAHATNHIHAVLPRWNRHAANTLAWMCSERLGALPTDQTDLELMSGYLSEATSAIIRMLESRGLTVHNEDPSAEPFRRWIASASQFPVSKKIKYLQAYLEATDSGHLLPAGQLDFRHKAHPKNESYVAGNKAQRAILAGNYQAAVVMGPICDIIGNVFFSTEYTSKKIAETDRPRLAMGRFTGKVILNDMSAFEGSITADIKNLVEQKVFKHFFPKYADYIDQYVKSDISVRVDRVSATIPNCRCSGDPQTSLGNSLTNLASIIAAVLYMRDTTNQPKQGADEILASLRAWVEGDDSLVDLGCVTSEPSIPASYTRAFELMGFATKMELKDFVGDAGYCSMFFNREGILIPSVAQTLIDFPWNHHPNNNIPYGQLLSLKARSIGACSPGAPILSALYNRYATRNLCISIPFNAYEAEEYSRQGFSVTPGRGTDMVVTGQGRVEPMAVAAMSRLLFEQKYGVTPTEQIQIEAIIEKKELCKIPDKFMRTICRVDGIDWDVCRRMYTDCCDRQVARPDPSPIDTCKDYSRDNDEETLVVKVNGTPSTVNKDYLPFDELSAIDESCREDSRIRHRWKTHRKLVEQRRRAVHRRLRHARLVRIAHMLPVYAVLFVLSALSPLIPAVAHDQEIWPSIERTEWVVPCALGGLIHIYKVIRFVVRIAVLLLGSCDPGLEPAERM